MELRQRRMFRSNFFSLEENCLHYKTKNLFSSFESEYPYEDLITHKLIKNRRPNYWLMVIFLVTLLGSISEWANYFNNDAEKESLVTNIWFSIAVLIFGILFFISRQQNTLIKISAGSHICFFTNSPNKEDVIEFLYNLKEKQKNTLFKRFVLDGSRTYSERLEYLSWMRDRNIITKDEFEEKKQEIEDEATGDFNLTSLN